MLALASDDRRAKTPPVRVKSMARRDGPTENYFRRNDLEVFRQAAKIYKVFIAVRRINPKSLEWIGKPGYTPKLIDCKAKTADKDVKINGKEYKTAGLVIDCDVFRQQLCDAFEPDSLNEAVKKWKEFSEGATKLASKSIFDGNGKLIKPVAPGFTYFTEMDPDHAHYGCLKHSLAGQAGSAKYVHGDYDLYAVVSPNAPADNIFVDEERLGQPHSRSPWQMDVQNYVTARIPGMINHGEQDTHKEDLDDDLDLFCPNGTYEPVIGEAAVARLYADLFRGRLMRDAKKDPSKKEEK